MRRHYQYPQGPDEVLVWNEVIVSTWKLEQYFFSVFHEKTSDSKSVACPSLPDFDIELFLVALTILLLIASEAILYSAQLNEMKDV
jgi:hypothetical protein